MSRVEHLAHAHTSIFSQQKAPAHSEHKHTLYGCRYIGMQLLGFDAKFLKGFLSELRHVRPKILTLKVFFFKLSIWKTKAFNLSKSEKTTFNL
jgi:hypothetical protein